LETASGAEVFNFGQSKRAIHAFDHECHGIAATEAQHGNAFAIAVSQGRKES
jgi:hypothetical protein